MTRLMVLGLLLRRPMHGYEIKQYLETTRAQDWAGILPGSIYHALKTMEREGLVEVQATETTGHRLRAVYAITAQGRARFTTELAGALRAPSPAFPSQLYTSLSFANELPPEDAARAITEQVEAVESELDRWNAGEAEKLAALEGSVDDLVIDLQKAVFENGRAHLEANLRLLKYVRTVLPSLVNSPGQVRMKEGGGRDE